MAEATHYMKLYIGDYLRDTSHLSTAEHGAYLLLIMHAWTRNGALPAADDRLRTIAKMDRREWVRSRRTILEFFIKGEGDTLRHKRIDRELANAAATARQRSDAGKASGEARQTQRKTNGRSTGVQRELNGLVQSPSLPSPPSSPPTPPLTTPTPSPPQPRAPKAAVERPLGSRSPANGAGPQRWDDRRVQFHPEDSHPDWPQVNGYYLNVVFDLAIEATMIQLASSPATHKPVIEWLASGYTDRQIIDTLHRVADRPDYRPPKTLAYFDKAVRDIPPKDTPLEHAA